VTGEALAVDWGLVPEPIIEVVRILNQKIEKASTHLGKLIWPEKPRDVQDLLRMSVSDSHKVAKAGTDLRSLLTAYAQRFHEPRPVMADLARAQDTSRQGIAARYTSATVAGVAELLSQQPHTGVILHSFRSLSLSDLTTISGPVGETARRQKDGDEPFVSYAALQASNREQASKKARQQLRDSAATLAMNSPRNGSRPIDGSGRK
jgi:hypothetical protein